MSWTEPSRSVPPSLRQCLLALWSRAGGMNLGGEEGHWWEEENSSGLGVVSDLLRFYFTETREDSPGFLERMPERQFFFFFPSDQRLFCRSKTCSNQAGSRLTVFHTGELAVTRSITVRHKPVWKSGILFFLFFWQLTFKKSQQIAWWRINSSFWIIPGASPQMEGGWRLFFVMQLATRGH